MIGRLAPLAAPLDRDGGTPGLAALHTRAWNEQSDRSDVREWLDNTRIFRKTLAELVKEYVDLLQDADPSGDHAKRLKAKREELEEHVRAMTEPTRVYSAQLPLFPEVYLLEVDFTLRSPRRINWPSRSGGNRPSQSRLAVHAASCER